MMIRAGASNREMVRGSASRSRACTASSSPAASRSPHWPGMIAAPLSSVYPGMGANVLIISFVVVVIGGIGSISGALIASLLVRLSSTPSARSSHRALGASAFTLLMAIVLVWRPEGLMKKGW